MKFDLVQTSCNRVFKRCNMLRATMLEDIACNMLRSFERPGRVTRVTVYLGNATFLVRATLQEVEFNVVISVHIRGMDKGYSCPLVSRMES